MSSAAAASTSRTTTTSVAAPATSAAAATTSRAVTSAAATTTAAAVTPSTTAAPVTSAAASSAAAASTVVIPNVATAASSSAQASSAAAASSSSSSAAAASSSSSAAPSSTSAPSSSASSSASRSSSASSSIASFVGSTSQTAAGSNSTLPGSTIGAIAGGVAGGLLLVALAFTCWRRMKGRKDKVPPPPPREMTFATSASTARARASSGAMLERGLGMGVGGMHRENSYATLLHNNPQGQMSRAQSYYTTYPIATPSTSDGSPPDTSPDFHPVADPAVVVGASNIPTASTSGSSTPHNPAIAAVEESDQRPASRSSRRISSVDRLRMEALGMGPVPRSPTQSSMQFPTPHPAHYPVPEDSVPGGSTTPPSPIYLHSNSGSSSSPMLGYPRPGSMSSLSSRGYNYLHVGPARGAPHQGRPIQLEMPRLLSGNLAEAQGGSPIATNEWGKRSSSGGRSPATDFLPNPYPASPPRPSQHQRAYSSNSLSGLPNPNRASSGSYQPSLGPMPGYQKQ